MNKVLVTGGGGLVGSQVKSDIKIYSKDYNLLDFDTTNKCFSEHKPDGIIHCAAKVGGLGSNLNHGGQYFYENILINTNVIEAARLNNVKKMVCFLSTCIFPDDAEYPLTEDMVHMGPPHQSNYPYAYAKRMVDVQIRAYKVQYGLDYKSVVPTNIYGVNDNFSLEDGHVIPSLIHRCYIARETNTPLIVWGSGKPLREFLYNKDVARLAEWVLDEYTEDQPIILSNSNEISIKDLVGIIVELMNFKGEVIFNTDKPDGQFRKPTDNSKLMSYLPNFEFTPIEVGLSETVEWFNNNYKNIRK